MNLEKPLVAAVLMLTATTSSGAFASNDGLSERIKFPEYDPRTACLENAIVPDLACVRNEIATRSLLLATWTTIDTHYGAAASSCIALLAHPDAAPASYSKLLACIAGELYAAE